jgi:large subunit ribosomal protein L15
MKLNELKDNQGATRDKKRVGRGIGSGTGKTAGRGHKGQKSRTGASIRPGFEGGQSPLYRRLPMRGFSNVLFTKEYTIINVGVLQKLVDDQRIDAGKPITIQTLQDIGFTKKAKSGLKVLGTGELKTKLAIEAAAASQSAQDKIKKAGGSISLPAEK